ncbi:Hypothetical protein PAU_03176 [Photorhabdus asymbiotica]|uniref:Uncharacterized protein n=1 Tax=Photorhabdus asymbiotica subsp. asymbiotica (strain ATCC 43949 / 3105-77) TaxID=553480 RepID=C7BH98_PHOAA|nr:Hypothetical protein PAU_03176 [Photorhabdus asymbiotica]
MIIYTNLDKKLFNNIEIENNYDFTNRNKSPITID